MKKYLAIGHWSGSKDIVAIADKADSMKAFRENLRGNEFVEYVMITERRMEALKSANVYDEVKKMTSNFRVWNDVADFIINRFDIVEEKFASVQ